MLEEQIMIFTEQLYNELEEGMSFQEVCERIGDSPDVISSESTQIYPGVQLIDQKTDLYEWKDDKDHYIRGLFLTGKLQEKFCNYIPD
jgi:hypothetical protein